MNEDFLHYVWKFQQFTNSKLLSVQNENIEVVKVGEHNHHQGPDFFNTQLYIGKQLWVGNLEIHLKSSDWYAHHHEKDSNYDNVILHVVWQHDTEIFRKNNTPISTLELKSFVHTKVLQNYKKLFSKKQQWINCENDFQKINPWIVTNWIDRLYFERLEQKSQLIDVELKKSNKHWEAVLFKLLCKNFGLKVNNEAFYSVASSFDFSLIKKNWKNVTDLEALFFGQAGLLKTNKEDTYYMELAKKYTYLQHKYKLSNTYVISPKFFRLRPPNFPTIRFSQLAMLYATKPSLFSEIIQAKSVLDYYNIFNIKASQYWDTHYNFGIYSTKRKKILTKKFIDLLIINTLIPLKFYYTKYLGKDPSEELIKLASSLPAEQNTIIKKFKNLGLQIENSLQSQGVLQLKNNYCNNKKCLNCTIGNVILKR